MITIVKHTGKDGKTYIEGVSISGRDYYKRGRKSTVFIPKDEFEREIDKYHRLKETCQKTINRALSYRDITESKAVNDDNN